MSTRVAVVGAGSLGTPLSSMLRTNMIQGCSDAGTYGRGDIADVDWSQIDVLVEAGGAGAAREWVPPALDAGIDVVLCSCGVFADDTFLERCLTGHGRILVPSGAVGGLDLLTAAARAGDLRVSLTTTKRTGALSTDIAGEIFRGTARQAALEFPRTSNVAVTIGLVIRDLDAVDVVVRADPTAQRSSHVLDIDSMIGHYRVELNNAVLPGSDGRTSAITLWSIVTTLEKSGPTALVVDPAGLVRAQSLS